MSDDEIRREKVPDDPRIADEPSHFAPGGGFERTDVEGNKKKAARSGDYKGKFEAAEMKRGRALFHPLTAQAETTNQIPDYDDFRQRYEIYKVPVHHTARSIARVQDLVASGAPRGPASIDPATVKKMEIDLIDEKGAPKTNAANQFAEQQSETRADFGSYMTARHSLIAALKIFRSAQQTLQARSLQVEKNDKEGKKAKIDKAAATLQKIATTVASANGYFTALEGAIASDEVYEDTTEWDEEAGKEVASARARKSSPTKKLFAEAKKQGGRVDLDLIIWAMGDRTEHKKLEREIENLEREIEAALNEADDLQISAAKDGLRAVRFQVAEGEVAFSSKRDLTRDSARNFGQALGGGHETILASLMAEAYQELDLFGSRALDEAVGMMPQVGPVHRWLDDHAHRYQMVRGDTSDPWRRDFANIGGAVVDVYKSRDLLGEEVPIWQQTALSWRHFLDDIMGTRFDKNDPMKKEEATRPDGAEGS